VSAGKARYHALVLKFDKRITAGWGANVNYTYSVNKDNLFGEVNYFGSNSNARARPLNAYDLDAEYAHSVLDTPHRLNISATYELPFGAGKRRMDREGMMNASWAVGRSRASAPTRAGSRCSSRVDVTARRGYVAPTADAVRENETAGSAPRAPSPVDDALGALARIRTSVDLSTHAVVTGREIAVVAEVGSAAASTWRNGGDVEVSVSTGGQAGMTSRGRIEAGTRSVLMRVPAGGESSANLRVAVRVSGTPGSTDRIDVAAVASGLVTEPLCFRLRLPARRFGLSPTFSSNARSACVSSCRCCDRWHGRLLDNRGQPLALPVTIAQTDATFGTGRVLAGDLTLAPLAPGDYVIEIAASTGVETTRRFLAIRVAR
jgi:hypothetical protein